VGIVRSLGFWHAHGAQPDSKPSCVAGAGQCAGVALIRSRVSADSQRLLSEAGRLPPAGGSIFLAKQSRSQAYVLRRA